MWYEEVGPDRALGHFQISDYKWKNTGGKKTVVLNQLQKGKTRIFKDKEERHFSKVAKQLNKKRIKISNGNMLVSGDFNKAISLKLTMPN